ncbi:MAG: PTS glucose transporter subunit IIA [Bifidobacteriaceae bacterium]|jgi:PTS system beta-glucosides-specific IIC component|nr:PTS glucose transporter subunit IIA [Bifidobacteriaceae bacterium]
MRFFKLGKQNNSGIFAITNGQSIPLEQVPDKAFSQGILGKGVGIIPKSHKILAPADGEISTIFDTLHAFSMTTNKGVEVLVHIGLDTVKLNGQGFKSSIKAGDKVKKGDLIIEADFALIQQKGYKIVTPVVILNSDNYPNMSFKYGEVIIGDEIIALE